MNPIDIIDKYYPQDNELKPVGGRQSTVDSCAASGVKS